jgi:hypothetical protein
VASPSNSSSVSYAFQRPSLIPSCGGQSCKLLFLKQTLGFSSS